MRIELLHRFELEPRRCSFCGARTRCEWDGVHPVCIDVAGCARRFAPREAAARAIIELDAIACGAMAPCVGPVERAISHLLPIANPRRREGWTAKAFVDACDERKAMRR